MVATLGRQMQRAGFDRDIINCELREFQRRSARALAAIWTGAAARRQRRVTRLRSESRVRRKKISSRCSR